MRETLSQIFSIIVTVQFLLVFSYMRQIAEKVPFLNNNAGILSSNLPDLWFGYTNQELNDLYEFWGPKGRKRYTSVASFDMMAFIPSYALTLGYICYQLISKELSLALWWIALIAWCDYVETFILMISCSAYPHGDVQHMDLLIQISSYANMAKWVLVVGLVAYLLHSVMQKKGPVEKDKKE